MGCRPDDLYDFVEALPQMVFHGYHVVDGDLDELRRRDGGKMLHEAMGIIDAYHRNLNAMLEREGSPYRVINGLLAPVTNEAEIAEVTAATTGTDKFSPARDHINEALKHLGARPPAYADCMKQAASALESALKIAGGDDTGRMAQWLARFEEQYGALHPALRTAIDKLYGYASDEEGVRHGATAPVTVGEPEARAMLVTCSALVNFLIRKAART